MCELQIRSTNTQNNKRKYTKNSTNTQQLTKINARIAPKSKKEPTIQLPQPRLWMQKEPALSKIRAKNNTKSEEKQCKARAKTMQSQSKNNTNNSEYKLKRAKISKTNSNTPQKANFKRKIAVCIYFIYKKQISEQQFKSKTPNLRLFHVEQSIKQTNAGKKQFTFHGSILKRRFSTDIVPRGTITKDS